MLSKLPQRFLAVLMAMLMLSVDLFAVAPDFNLRRGTTVPVRLVDEVKSKGKGAVAAIVDGDVYAPDGKLLIKQGEVVNLQVQRKRARGCGIPGRLTINVVSTKAVDGQTVSMEGTLAEKGRGRIGLAVGLGAGLGMTFLPLIGFAFLAIRGKQAVIEPNTLIPNVTVASDYVIK